MEYVAGQKGLGFCLVITDLSTCADLFGSFKIGVYLGETLEVGSKQ